ncbi:MAG: autotransporter outer membrane beta-barrel domain-containing protein [Sphaerochaetaceae bacterium]|nr:autotransporter outer membrane beta-barrel domain-containing protein [Sphaerochaetaceae bacterium]
MKKSILVCAIFALVTYAACAATTTHTLNLANTVEPDTDTTITLAYKVANSAISVTAANNIAGEATVTEGSTIIEAGSFSNKDISAKDAQTIQFVVYNKKSTNFSKGNNQALNVEIEKEDWALSAGVTNEATQKNPITLSKSSGTILFPVGRQYAGASSFTFNASWNAKDLEAGAYAALIRIKYSTL